MEVKAFMYSTEDGVPACLSARAVAWSGLQKKGKKAVVTDTYRRLMVVGSKLMEAVGPDRYH
jgi:hypothetical protein